VSKWFTAAGGALLNPGTTAYWQIAENIKQSFRTFEDSDHHGDDDHESTPGTTP
jgi:hypothetical protein